MDALAASRRRVGVAILVFVMVAASVFGLLVGLFFPEGDDGHFTYGTVADSRTFFRTWLVLAALNLILGLTAFALAGWLLVPARGWIAATVGACLTWVGCASLRARHRRHRNALLLRDRPRRARRGGE